MEVKDKYFSKKHTLNIDGELYSLKDPIVMGILNITPDSFYDGGKYSSDELVLNRVKEVICEGGSIIDIGAYSSRPNAKHISEKEELNRLLKTLETIRKSYPDLWISVDTFRASVARKAIEEYNVQFINDISAGEMDKEMFPTIAELNPIYIMMHMQGVPQSMQKKPVYENLIKDICLFFSKKCDKLYQMGVNDIIIDPGFGFGKTVEHNYELLNNLNALEVFELPILVGISRKSMIYKFLGISPDEALNGTSIINTIALQKGADILRVHDVKEAVECIKLLKKTFESN